MLSHEEFGRLRMRELLPDYEIFETDNFEWLGQLWIAEGPRGFTSFCRLHDVPDVVKAVEIDLATITEGDGRRLLDSLQLKIAKGMTVADVRAILGEPSAFHKYSDDRATLGYEIAGRDAYSLTVTVMDDGGLIYVTMHTPLPKPID